MIAQAQGAIAHDLPVTVLYYTAIIEATNFASFEGWVNMTYGIMNTYSFLNIHKPLVSRTPLEVTMTVPPTAAPNQDIAINVSVEDKGSTIDGAGATVTLTATDGTFAQDNGTTDSNGYFATTFHTPAATSLKTVTLNATVVKFQYTDGVATSDVTINPAGAQLSVTIKGEDEIKTKEASDTNEATFEVTVTAGSLPVKDAAVTMTANLPGGEFSPTTLNTDDNGKATFKFKASVTVEARYKVTATATKAGYLDGIGTKDIIVKPIEAGTPQTDWLPIAGISVVIVIAVLIILLGLVMRMKEKKKAAPPPPPPGREEPKEAAKEAPKEPKEGEKPAAQASTTPTTPPTAAAPPKEPPKETPKPAASPTPPPPPPAH